MTIRKTTHITPGGRTGTLRNVQFENINNVLGFEYTNPGSDGDGKVTKEWYFYCDGHHCGIWDYKGSSRFGQWSTSGSHEVFRKLFRDKYETP